jgi:hypothetical protein
MTFLKQNKLSANDTMAHTSPKTFLVLIKLPITLGPNGISTSRYSAQISFDAKETRKRKLIKARLIMIEQGWGFNSCLCCVEK